MARFSFTDSNRVRVRRLRFALMLVAGGVVTNALAGAQICTCNDTFMFGNRAVGSSAAQFVKPYVKTNKNDVADAEVTCEAVS